MILWIVLSLRSERCAAQRIAANITLSAGAIAFLGLGSQGLLDLLPRKAGYLLDFFELPIGGALFGRARIRLLMVWLGAAAKAQEIVIKALVVRVNLRATLIAHTLVPRSTRV